MPTPIEPVPAVLCAEEQLRLLSEMAAFGMGLIRGLKAGEAGTAEEFVRLSRAVRLTFVLQTKVHEGLHAFKVGLAQMRELDEAEAAEAARDAQEAAVRRNKAAIKRLVLTVAESESESLEDYNETYERLEHMADHHVRFRDLGEWRLRGAVEALCEDLNIHPDWDRWTGDGWDERYVNAVPRWRRESSRRLETTPSSNGASNGAHAPNGASNGVHAAPNGRRLE